jgi:hypothetical protein
MLLAQRKDFWQPPDRAHMEGEKKVFTGLEGVRPRPLGNEQTSIVSPEFVSQVLAADVVAALTPRQAA